MIGSMRERNDMIQPPADDRRIQRGFSERALLKNALAVILASHTRPIASDLHASTFPWNLRPLIIIQKKINR